MTIDLQRARTFVEAHGTAIDQARLRALLTNAPPADMPADLRTLQNDDGGFAFGMIAGRPSALGATSNALSWLRDLKLADSDVADRALNFITQRQTPRGIWREDRVLQRYGPPPWSDPDSPAADIYTTAICASTLALHHGDEFAIDQAVTWLQTQQGRDGLLAGFKAHSSWLAVPAFVDVFGEETRATRRLIAGLGTILDDEWTPAMLAWLLQSLLDAGYTRRTTLVDRAWTALFAAQQPDGSFGAEEGADQINTVLRVIDVAQRIRYGPDDVDELSAR